MKFRLRRFLPIALMLCCGLPLRAQTLDISQQWAVGKKYFLTTRTAYQSKVVVEGETTEEGMEMTAEMSLAVTPHEDGTRKRMVLRYERIATEVKSNGRKMGFDSAKPKARTDTLGLGKSIGAMVGKNLKLIVDARGEVLEVDNFDELLRQLKGSDLTEPEIRKMFDKDSLNQAVRQGALQALPDKPVAPGDRWPFVKEVKIPQLSKGSIAGTYDFKKMGKRDGVACAEIAVAGTVTADSTEAPKGGASADEATPSQVKITDGAAQGTLWFDPKLGVAREAQLTQKMTISMKNPLDESATLSVPVKQTFTTTLTKVVDLK